MGINVVNRAGLGFTYANVDDLGLMVLTCLTGLDRVLHKLCGRSRANGY